MGFIYSPSAAEYFDNIFEKSIGADHPFSSKMPFYEVIKDKEENKALLIGLNSCSMTSDPSDIAKGEIGEIQLRSLDKNLNRKTYENMPKIIFLHHIPHRRAKGFGMSLKDYKKLMNIVRDRVDVLAFGHEGSMIDPDDKRKKVTFPARPMKIRSGIRQKIRFYLDANESTEDQSVYQITIEAGRIQARLLKLS
jgi:hypothetical protein